MRGSRKSARSAIAAFALATLVLNIAAACLLDGTRLGLRDPEYSRRIARLRQRIAANQDRPLVLVVGSSRTAMGVRPGEWEASRPATNREPLLFNLGMIGGGPLLERIVIQRALADGIQPAAVLLEYWPPLFDRPRNELPVVSVDRLSARESETLATYCASDWPANRLNPVYGTRSRLLSQLLPRWLPAGIRLDWTWSELDEWGWKSGCDFQPGPSESRTILVKQARGVFTSIFETYRNDPRQERAFRDALAELQSRGIPVGLIYMPEASEFRQLYPAPIEQSCRQQFEQLIGEFQVPCIDARTWMADDLFSDGFHLTRIGAAEFTRKLGPLLSGLVRDRRP